MSKKRKKKGKRNVRFHDDGSDDIDVSLDGGSKRKPTKKSMKSGSDLSLAGSKSTSKKSKKTKRSTSRKMNIDENSQEDRGNYRRGRKSSSKEKESSDDDIPRSYRTRTDQDESGFKSTTSK